MLGYDRAITVFSPDGRLLQVEYARKTVNKGATVIGIVGKNSVVFIAEKRIPDNLIVVNSIEKIFQVDTHIGAAASGLISDARVLVKRAQEEAKKYQMTYDEPIDIQTLVKEICDYKQFYTQYGGIRPFGISLLIGGVDDTGARLFVTEPAGTFFEYKAIAIGEGSVIVNKFLGSNYKDGLSKKEIITLGIKALKKFLGAKYDENKIQVVSLDGEFKNLKPEEIKKALKGKQKK
jgi:proteasome alpha subunit